MRDLERRLARLEALAARQSIVSLWQGERPADDVMMERFGSTTPPPGVVVHLYRWAEPPA